MVNNGKKKRKFSENLFISQKLEMAGSEIKMESINNLIDLFKRFPGIGPRQARRFVYFLMSRTPAYNDNISNLISDLKKETAQCEECFRFFIVKNSRLKRHQRAEKLYKIIWDNYDYKYPMDMIVYTPSEVKKRLDLRDFFIKRIFKHGKVLYES